MKKDYWNEFNFSNSIMLFKEYICVHGKQAKEFKKNQILADPWWCDIN